MTRHESPHYYTSGFFAGSRRPLSPGTRPSLIGTEIEVAGDIEHRLKRSRHPVLFVELGGETAASSAVLAELFARDIRAGKLTIMVTNRERRSITQMLQATERFLRRSKHPSEMIPDSETAAFIRENMHLMVWQSGTDTTELPNLTVPYGGADVIHECMAGLFFHPDRPRALQAVVASLKRGGRLYTRETPDKDRSYGNFPSDYIKSDHFYIWGIRGYRTYTRTGL